MVLEETILSSLKKTGGCLEVEKKLSSITIGGMAAVKIKS